MEQGVEWPGSGWWAGFVLEQRIAPGSDGVFGWQWPML